MKSTVVKKGSISLPLIVGETRMVPFDMSTFEGLTDKFKDLVKQMMAGIKHAGGTAYFTLHGKKLKKCMTLRRPGPHTDGNYEPHTNCWDTKPGWKVEDGYSRETGGLIMVSNYQSCLGWTGEYPGLPGNDGDCSHIDLDEAFMLEEDQVYYGNNHFIHESLPVTKDVHRVLARITMPEDHVYSY